MKKSGVPLGEWNGSDATKDLHKDLLRMEKSSNRVQGLMLLLAFVGCVAAVIAALPVVQSWLK